MIKQNLNISKNGGIVAILIVFGIVLLTVGCGEEEVSAEGKTAVMAEANETGHKCGDEKEEHGVVKLSQEMQRSSGIEVKQVAIEEVAVPLSATAVIEMNMDRAAMINPRMTGKTVRIIASQGDKVKAGQPLAYLDSVELYKIWADYLKALGKVELTRKSLQREEILFQKKISPEKDVLKARQELGEAETDLNLAKEHFRLFGVDIAQFAEAKGNGSHPLVSVTSPVSGVVIEKAITQGEIVNPEKMLFMVADLSTLWVIIDVYEKDMSSLRVGADVKVSVTPYPDKIFKGKISYIADVVDEKTRTEKARVTIDNASGLLKPGMFATILTEARNGGNERLIAVPEEAVLFESSARYVFVRVSPDKFKKRDIETGRVFGKSLEVTAGLKEGEMIAVKGTFILKSELKKDEIEGDEH